MKDDENKLLEYFEESDTNVVKERAKNLNDVYLLEEIEYNREELYLRNQKKKWESTLPTIIEYYNESIQHSENKINIL